MRKDHLLWINISHNKFKGRVLLRLRLAHIKSAMTKSPTM